MFGQIPFSLETKVAILAGVRSHVGVSSNMLLQH